MRQPALSIVQLGLAVNASMEWGLPPIAWITAGAAGMYCGSCMHDNTLAKSLREQGIDVVLVPTYTPIRTDEVNVSLDRVFFGGINVYLDQYLPFYRWIPSALVGWLDAPRILQWASRRGIQTDAADLGPLCVSMLRGEHGRQRREVLKLIHFLERELRPGLVCFSNVLIAGCVELVKARLGVPIVVMLQGDDLFLQSLPESARQLALAQIARIDRSVDLYLAHSNYYADHMASVLNIARGKIRVVPLAIHVEDFQRTDVDRRRDTRRHVTVGYLARLAPEKGLHLICQAVETLRSQPDTSDVRLTVAGWLSKSHRDYARHAMHNLEQTGGNALQYLGEVSRMEKLQLLADIDVLCVPSPHPEPKGLYALEAMAAGVPVVVPDHGIFPELLAETGGGRLFRAGDADNLVATLQELLTNHTLRRGLGNRGKRSISQTHNDTNAAIRVLATLKELIQPG